MSDIDVRAFLNQLRQALPQVPPIDVRALRKLHEKRDYEGMVRLIRSSMNLEARLMIGWVNSGGPKEMVHAPAWVQMPENMPFYGTPEFKKIGVKMFIRKSFLEQSTYGEAAVAIAHELSHVVLNSIHHPLRKEEKAVDLTAMLLGFSRLYDLNVHRSVVTKVTRKTVHTEHRKLGYLSKSELSAASKILNPFYWRLRLAIPKVVALLPLLILIGFWIFLMTRGH